MIVRLVPGTDEVEVAGLRRRFEERGVRTAFSGGRRPAIALLDAAPADLVEEITAAPCVQDVARPQGSWRQVDRAFRDELTVVSIGDVKVGGGDIIVIAGPCSVEGQGVMQEAARIVAASGAHVLRGGAFKPRTSPYSFQGLGREGLVRLRRAGDAVHLPVVSEIMDARQLSAFVDCGIDCLQVGARNMQNFSLLKSVAEAGKPVLLKRGLAATVSEWLDAAEYLLAHGCDQVVLCERGIRTFETATRNTLDLTVLPLLDEWTHLPVIVDPSHAAGIARLIPALSRASIAAGAAGVAVEVHPRPEEARSDGPQALLAGELARLVADARVLAAVTGRRLHPTPGGVRVDGRRV